MENVEQPVPTKTGFFKHMFDLAGEDKGDLLNYLQYVVLALVPVVIVLKLLRAYIPDEDPDQGAFATLGESLAQILVIFLSIWLIDRLVRFVPTYSGVSYKPMYLTNFVAAFLMVLLTMQSKLGAKINILVDKVTALWNGDTSLKDKKVTKQAAAAPKQTAVAQNTAIQSIPTRQPITQQAPQNYLNNNLGVSAPPNNQIGVPPPMQQPDFNSMYAQDNITLPDSNFPANTGLAGDFAPANMFVQEGFGSGFGSAY